MTTRRRAVSISFVVAFSVAVLAAIILRIAAYRYALSEQHKAERALSAIKMLHPGVTTALQVDAALKSLLPSFNNRCGRESGSIDLQYFNNPAWSILSNEHTPHVIRNIFTRLLLPKWTMFTASLTCDAGVLAGVRLNGAQDSGWVHPYGAIVELVAANAPFDRGTARRGADYSVTEMATSVWNEHESQLTPVSPLLYRVVHLTENASPDERSRALDFHLDCFTRSCQSADQILHPAPDAE